MNMMANFQTKLALYLNDESEVVTLMGRERVPQVEIVGRGQVMEEFPTAIQFYLPAQGKTSTEVLEHLEKEVLELDQDWQGARPEKIPMVPEELKLTDFEEIPEVIEWQEKQGIAFGMSYQTTEILGFVPGQQPYFLFAPMDDEQELLFKELLLTQLSKVDRAIIIVDFNESFEEALEEYPSSENVTFVTDKAEAKEVLNGIVGYMQLVKKRESGESMFLVIADLQDFVQKTGIKANSLVSALKNTYKAGLDILIFSPHEYISKSFDAVPKAIRPLKFTGLIGSTISGSSLIKGTGVSSEPELSSQEAYFVLRGGSKHDKIKLPQFERGEKND